jgi:hypothetical protein
MSYILKRHRPDILSKSMIRNYHNISAVFNSGTCNILIDIRMIAIAESGITNPYQEKVITSIYFEPRHSHHCNNHSPVVHSGFSTFHPRQEA